MFGAPLARRGATVAVALVAVAIGVILPAQAASAADPVVTISPGPHGGLFNGGESVTVSVGPNSVFQPYSRILILECSDPDGTTANLPKGFDGCDEHTLQGDTVIVKPNGSFSEANYNIYALPDSALGEQGNWAPDCNTTNECVLFVGEDQNDFSKPHEFSAPFEVTADSSSTTTGGTPAATDVPPSATADPSPSVSLPAATLAFTGTAEFIPVLVALGLGMVGLGVLMRRKVRWRKR